MTPKELNKSYQEKKDIFHNYIYAIKKNAKWNLNTIINPTLVKNPYASTFPKYYFSKTLQTHKISILFIKNTISFLVKNICLLFSYLIALVLYKLYYKKQRKNNLENIIDVFGLVNVTNKNSKFRENYLSGIYEIFDKYEKYYAILIRPYQAAKNPFKLIQFFKIINEDSRDFIFEYELLSFYDFIKLFIMILNYPFKTLRLLQKEKHLEDKIFNQCLIQDLKHFNFESFTRYILGKKLSKIKGIKKIYSWSEFQVIERSFNYAIRKNCNHIELIGLQGFINYETYFNAYADDIDYIMLSSPHKMFVNGKYYIMNRKRIKYDIGVSFRYQHVFNFTGVKEEKNILLLGSYIFSDTKYMLDSIKNFDDVIFVNHSAVDIKRFGKLPGNITLSNKNIYKLFKTTKLVVVTASGTGAEAVACGICVIIIASQDNLTANPLVEKGKGKIWDIAFNINEIDDIYKKLIDYRANNQEEIIEIAKWYKNNFFIEPTEESIVRVFELEKDK